MSQASSFGEFLTPSWGSLFNSFGDSPSQRESQEDVTVRFLKPFTVAQLLQARLSDCPSDSIWELNGAPVSQVAVIGQAYAVSPSKYTINDGTGCVEVRYWVEFPSEDLNSNLESGSYVKVVGMLKTFGNKRYINASWMRLSVDPHEIYFHFLEVIAVSILCNSQKSEPIQSDLIMDESPYEEAHNVGSTVNAHEDAASSSQWGEPMLPSTPTTGFERSADSEIITDDVVLSESPTLFRRPDVPIFKPTPLDRFFTQYPEFSYNPSNPVSLEFHKLSQSRDWGKGGVKRIREEFKDALTFEFNEEYGTDVDDIAAWHRLCRALCIDPLPDDIFSCERAFRSTHVNLVDFVDMPRTGCPVRKFETEEMLRKYSIQECKIFPRARVGTGSLLRYLLRRIFA